MKSGTWGDRERHGIDECVVEGPAQLQVCSGKDELIPRVQKFMKVYGVLLYKGRYHAIVLLLI